MAQSETVVSGTALSARRVRPREVALAVAGLLIGLSSFAQGLYARTEWALVGISVLVGIMVAVVAVRRWPRPGVLAGVLALVTLGVVQYASTGWAQSASQALVEAQRTVLYAALLAGLILLLDDARSRAVLVGAVAVGVLPVIAYDLVLLYTGSEGAFVRGRIFDPIGYSNALAFVLLLVLWPGVALAEQERRAWVGAVGVALATLACAIALSIQSRGAIVGLAASAALAVAVLPGRPRRIGILVVVIVATAIAAPALLDVYDQADPATGLPGEEDARMACLAALGVAIAAGLAWLGLLPLGRRAARSMSHLNQPYTRVAAVAGIALFVIVGAIALSDKISQQWDEFRALAPVSIDSRFSAGGNRYDYWRVAWNQFESAPLVGIGAGNYDETYFRERRTTEDIRQPHSLPLQALGETGLLGAALLGLFVFCVAAGAWRARRGWVARSPLERGVVVAAWGTFVLWLAHTSVDWLHLLPGVTAAALASAAVLIVEPRSNAQTGGLGGARVRPVAFAAAAVATASMAIGWMADTSRERAEEQVATDPAGAVEDARRSIELDPEATSSYIVLSAAQARMGDYDGSRETLLEAQRRKPTDFIVPVLLGDLASRRGLEALAREHYERAASLNPQDEGIRQLAEGTAP